MSLKSFFSFIDEMSFAISFFVMTEVNKQWAKTQTDFCVLIHDICFIVSANAYDNLHTA